MTYNQMRLEDGWCRNFDKVSRLCKIYDNRPEFCKVDRNKFRQIYAVDEDAIDDFCIYCCRSQISDVYGRHSLEAKSYEDAINSMIKNDLN